MVLISPVAETEGIICATVGDIAAGNAIFAASKGSVMFCNETVATKNCKC